MVSTASLLLASHRTPARTSNAANAASSFSSRDCWPGGVEAGVLGHKGTANTHVTIPAARHREHEDSGRGGAERERDCPADERGQAEGGERDEHAELREEHRGADADGVSTDAPAVG
jgi:hypothetical protein